MNSITGQDDKPVGQSGRLTHQDGDSTLIKLGEYWTDQGFPYVVCNGVTLDGKICGRDLDILVDQSAYKAMVEATQTLLQSEGWDVRLHRKSHTCLLFALCQQSENRSVLEIDFFWYQQWGLMRILSSASELTDRYRAGTFQLSPWACFVKNHLIQILCGNFGKVSRRMDDADALLTRSPAIQDQIREHVGQHAAARVVSAFRSGNIEAIRAQAPELRRKAWIRAFNPISLHSLLAAIKSLIKFRYEYKVRCRPVSPILAVVGPDGAGKSTILEALQPKLLAAFPFWSIRVQHWRPGLLPPIGFWFGKEPHTAGSPVLPRWTGGRFYFFRLIYYCLDFLFGYFLKDRILRSTLTPVFYDRCFWDMYVDPARFGFRKRTGMLALGRILPGPDLIVCLSVRPEVARIRKGELTDNEVSEQNKRWVELSKTIDVPITILWSDEAPSVLAEKIVDIYLKHMLTSQLTK